MNKPSQDESNRQPAPPPPAIVVAGIGAVSPAGWGMPALRAALERGADLPSKELARPGSLRALQVRPVPPPPQPARPAHARLRRASAVSHYLAAAAREALGLDSDATVTGPGSGRLGIVTCVMSGCVNYSRRFYDEVLRDPATASPLVFPETVFNAPSSHLAAMLGTTAINYTLVGDPASFPLALALGAGWIQAGLVEECVVAGAEELDWLTADAFRLFARRVVVSEGAGALYLKAGPAGSGQAVLAEVTSPELFWNRASRDQAAARIRTQLGAAAPDAWLCDGRQGVGRLDRSETGAWQDWKGGRCSPKSVLGEGLMAAAAWQCALAADAVRAGRCGNAVVSVVGCNAQAAGCRFSAP